MSRKLLLVFLLIVVVAAAGFWQWRKAIFSKEILKLEILGPETAKMGEEITYTVKYKNNGDFVLQNPKLVFELPENSLTEGSATRLVQELSDIYPGEESFASFKTRLLGQEEELKTAKASLSYVPKNLSARYESTTAFATKIDSVPVSLTLDLPSAIEKGKQINYTVNYFSTLDYPLENMSVKVDYPSGFNFESSEPLSLDDREWRLETLNKSRGGRINIKGTITADQDSLIVFSAKLGMWRDGTFVVIRKVDHEAQATQPLLFVSQIINGIPNYVVSPGETLRYELFIRNVGFTSFNDLLITSRLEGPSFDSSTLASFEGQARQGDNFVVFDSKKISRLKRLGPQEEIKVEFTVKLKDDPSAFAFEGGSAVIKNKVNVFDVVEKFTNKVSSKLEVLQKGYYSTMAGIENSGPLPPENGKTTTYTILWQARNLMSDVKNVKIKATLPEGIGLVDRMVPESQVAHFSFDSASRQIVWFVGDLLSNANTPLLYLQVALTPSSSQKGSVAKIIGQAVVSGEDWHTGRIIQNTASAIDTGLPDDSNNPGGGIVR